MNYFLKANIGGKEGKRGSLGKYKKPGGVLGQIEIGPLLGRMRYT